MEEVWRNIEGFEKYQVSTLGRVRPVVPRYKGHRYLKPKSDKDGYLYVTISGKSLKIHRIVAKAFIPNPDNLPCINHKSEDKTVNTVENLEWCTHKYNCNYGTRLQRGAKHRQKKVVQLKNGVPIKMYASISKAAEENGLVASGISNVLHGRRLSYGGYQWLLYQPAL